MFVKKAMHLYYINETLIAILEFFPVCLVFDWFYIFQYVFYPFITSSIEVKLLSEYYKAHGQ